MAIIFMVISGFFYYGIVRGRKPVFKGRLNSCKSMMKTQEAPFHGNGSPFHLKTSDFLSALHSFPSLLDFFFLEGLVHRASRSSGCVTSSRSKDFSAFSPPRFLRPRICGPI